uniref:Uncharacterized protein n=1 Tax=Anguilla anguilla TaxID=7936 RepID=A0A0E9VH59_ANGAN
MIFSWHDFRSSVCDMTLTVCTSIQYINGCNYLWIGLQDSIFI